MGIAAHRKQVEAYRCNIAARARLVQKAVPAKTLKQFYEPAMTR